MTTEERLRRLHDASFEPGKPAVNRFRVRGTLTCLSPLHIGSGNGDNEVDALIETDCDGYPVVTGSALRGVVRHLLAGSIGADPMFVTVIEKLLGPEAKPAGGSLSSGKVVFEDAPRTKRPAQGTIWSAGPPHWNPSRGTYRVPGVSIDFETGAAEEGLLFNVEAVPRSTEFDVTITGTNLLDEELGLLLWALDVLGSPDGVATLGAHSGTGFGRVKWTLGSVGMFGVRATSADEMNKGWPQQRREAWRQQLDELLKTRRRSLGCVTPSPLANEDVERIKAAWIQLLPAAQGNDVHVVVPYTLTLASDLVIRSGGEKGHGASTPTFHACTSPAKADEEEGDPKRRGSSFEISRPGTSHNAWAVELAPPLWQVVLDSSGSPLLQFQVPGATLRGTFRSRLVRDLISSDIWARVFDAETNETNLSSDAKYLRGLFGTTDGKGRIEFESAAPDGTQQLRWRYEGHETTDSAGVPAAPSPPMRANVRGPVDRMASGAKSGGLHYFASVDQGARFTGQILIRAAGAKDLHLLRLWRDMLAARHLTLGGTGAVGYGAAQVNFGTPRFLCARTLRPVAPNDEVGQAARLLEPVATASPVALDPHASSRGASSAALQSAVAPSATQRLNGHYMNPYDFVAFPRKRTGDGNGDAKPEYIAPKLALAADWEAQGELLSGTIVVEMEALQPVHIMGRSMGGQNDRWYAFHRSASRARIPGATLRGLIRSYVEARWNGWVSIYSRNADIADDCMRNPDTSRNPYVKAYTARYVGFNADTRWKDWSMTASRWKAEIEQAIPNEFVPPEPGEGGWAQCMIDAGTFLFGTVLQFRTRAAEQNGRGRATSRRGRVRVEGCDLADTQLDKTSYSFPDFDGDTFFGGPKPSKSSMFYFEPGSVYHRVARGHPVAQFVAGPFRGRKFYFHQDPQACVNAYPSELGVGRDAKRLVRRPLECMNRGERATFRIHFDRLPREFLLLLLVALEPSGHIRHKVGYGKPFGLGSVRFRVKQVIRRQVGGAESAFSLQETTEDIESLRQEIAAHEGDRWSWACDPEAFVDSDRWLRYILTYPSDQQLKSQLFLYPGPEKFRKPNPPAIIKLYAGDTKLAKVSDAKAYWPNHKQALHLGLYQRKSPEFGAVCARATLSGERALDQVIHTEAM